MTCVAGVDGTPGGWAVVIMAPSRLTVQKLVALSDLFDGRSDLRVVSVDVPIGLSCALSRASALQGKAISKQTFAILPKIREIDDLLQTRTELRAVVREVHPEVSFAELVGKPMIYLKSSMAGREERRTALSRVLPNLRMVENAGREQGLPIEDILDATVACWSASRLAAGRGRGLPETVTLDSTGLPMVIWV